MLAARKDVDDGDFSINSLCTNDCGFGIHLVIVQSEVKIKISNDYFQGADGEVRAELISNILVLIFTY